MFLLESHYVPRLPKIFFSLIGRRTRAGAAPAAPPLVVAAAVVLLLPLLLLLVLLVGVLDLVREETTAEGAGYRTQRSATELVAGETAAGSAEDGSAEATLSRGSVRVVRRRGTLRVVPGLPLSGVGTVLRLLAVGVGAAAGVVVLGLVGVVVAWRRGVSRRWRRGVLPMGRRGLVRARGCSVRCLALRGVSLVLLVLIMAVALLWRVALMLVLRRVAAVALLLALRRISTLGRIPTLLVTAAAAAVKVVSRH